MDNLDFGIHMPIRLFEVDGQVFGFTTTHINTWLVMAFLILVALVIRIKINNFTEVPNSKMQNIVEFFIGMFNDFTANTMGETNRRFSGFYGPMFLFILLSNLTGLIGLRPPTADIATTFALSLTTFFMVQWYGIRYKKGAYITGLFEPFALLFPLNVIGELANPVSLGFRLFGNILGGTIIMGLYYAMLNPILTVAFPAVFHLYFDVFAGVLQTLIFVMLSMTFVSSAMEN